MNNNLDLAGSQEIKEKFNWHDLLFYLDNGLVVPVIGSNLFHIKDDGSSQNVPLYEHMHQELLKEMPKEKRNDDFWEFMEINKKPISQRIKVFLQKKQANIDETPLIKLAKISNFRDYICMTYDNFFEPILRKERGKKEEIQTIDFAINNNSIDQFFENQVTIFNLIGNIDKINGFAKTEEEILEHLYSLTVDNPATKKFFSQMEGKHFLFIGCNFPDWLLRFFIRIFTNERLYDANFTKFIADDTTLNNPKLCMFLNHFNSSIFQVPNATAGEFVNELYDRWKKRNSEREMDEPKYQGVVFLSYSSEDREVFAEKLYQKLKLKGVNVYYDQNKLDSGDYFSPNIDKEIINCKYFVSLISKNSLDPGRFVIKEIKTALLAEEYKLKSAGMQAGDSSFIRPYIIDDTKPSDPRIQELIPHISIPSGQSVDDIADAIIPGLEPITITDPEA